MSLQDDEKDLTPISEEDSVWKEMLDQYFEEFISVFFPVIHQDIDWRKPYEFLDTELEKIVRDSTLGRRLADKLVKVYLASGKEAWLLTHVEVQGYPDPDFAERMYIYNYRIFDRYHQEVISLAVLTDASKRYRPSFYRVNRWGFELLFRFPIVKLIDYNKAWAQLEADANPFAIVVMAHLKTRQLRRSRQLLAWKLKLVRMLYERGYERQDVLELFRFLDWLIKLPRELEEQFKDEMTRYEESRTMPYVTSVERIAREEGREEGMVKVVLSQLKQRLGGLDGALEQNVKQLSTQQLEELGLALLDFSNTDELAAWLEKKSPEEK